MRTYLLAFLLLCALPVLSQDNEESDICTPKRCFLFPRFVCHGFGQSEHSCSAPARLLILCCLRLARCG